MGKVRIYGTLGPACRDTETLKRMFKEGMDGVRLNLSHTSLEETSDMIENFHRAASECGISPELLIDMQGPELRIGKLEEPALLREGDLIESSDIPLPETVTEVLEDSERGQELLLDDGKILLRTESGSGKSLRVVRGGILESRKSVALPGCVIQTPAMTRNDLEQIARAGEFGVTAVMQPFVRSKADLIEVREALDEADRKSVV